MPGSTIIADWLGRGDATDLPVAATLHGLLYSGAAAFFYAEDTGVLYVLNRDTVAWDDITSGSAGITELTGDVTAGPGSGSQAATIADDAITTAKIVDSAVTNAKLADMAAYTFKMNATGSTDAPQDVDAASAATVLSPYFPGSFLVITNTQTSNYLVLVADSGQHFNNIGATGAVEFTLPEAITGLHYGFLVFEPERVQINADGGDVITLGENASDLGGFIGSDAPFSFVKLESPATGVWIASSQVGSWSIDAWS